MPALHVIVLSETVMGRKSGDTLTIGFETAGLISIFDPPPIVIKSFGKSLMSCSDSIYITSGTLPDCLKEVSRRIGTFTSFFMISSRLIL